MKTFLGSLIVLLTVIGCVLVYKSMGSFNACQNAGAAYADAIAKSGGNPPKGSYEKMNQECLPAKTNGKIIEGILAPAR
ncbi:MAG: hypothetical protein Q7T66_01285 [Herminiimonas sp.]|uniref:hypothetical protein n=1 Tax=Herminiimonas sp. TaxID=1926289 RepID=UPI00271CDAE6|nr:hypothetical protein [Herminiimonas sp.]MDO9419272.1 hypothetical protein [Herminiimonas sp.]